MFTQCVLILATFIVVALSDFTIHQEAHQVECKNLVCPKGAFDEVHHPLIKDDSKEQKCTICKQCTDFGYSVCAQALSSNIRSRRQLDANYCTCANYVPASCKDNQVSAKKDTSAQLFRICYLSTLRTPPKVLGLNQEKDFIVTLDQFWLEPYWRDFELSNLTLFYSFEVKAPEHCDGIGKVKTMDDSSTPLHICTSSLPIDMNGENIPDSSSNKKSYDPTDNDDQYDDDAPPEVEFGRDVFFGAKFVELWYTVTVRRPRQLSFKDQTFRNVTTTIQSEILKHNLEPEIYGNGGGGIDAEDEDDKASAPASKSGHDSVSKVNIENVNKDVTNDDDDDDNEDEQEDKADPIPSDSPGITDDSEEEEEGMDSKTDDDKEEDETEDANKEPEEKDDDKKDNNDEGEDTEDTEDSEEATTVAASDEEETTPTESDESPEDTEATVLLDNDVTAGNETESFFKAHFTNWPMMRVAFVLIGIASIILIAAACCYRYRGCCCYSDQQKVVTKTSNGYEYHVTGQQTGQEMVGPPETEKLTH